jgi:ABC-type Fe3+-hydroxamate transport system substrate-binding protein
MRDHLGRALVLAGPPRRVVSLVPSITETVLALGGALVGRTSFCPPVPGVPACGGTKNPSVPEILALGPDLVLANQEENRERDVAALAGSVPVFVTDVRTVQGALAWVEELRDLLAGRERGREPGARAAAPPGARRFVALVWRAPLVAIGEDTYAADVLRACGLANSIPDQGGRYPRTGEDELAFLRPDLLVLPSEPYPWSRAEGDELEAELARRGAPVLRVHVDGEALTWWGARTARAVSELRGAFH